MKKLTKHSALLLTLFGTALFSQGANAWWGPFDGPWNDGPWSGYGPGWGGYGPGWGNGWGGPWGSPYYAPGWGGPWGAPGWGAGPYSYGPGWGSGPYYGPTPVPWGYAPPPAAPASKEKGKE